MKVEFNSKEEIVECLVKEYGYRKSQLYNSATNSFGHIVDVYNI